MRWMQVKQQFKFYVVVVIRYNKCSLISVLPWSRLECSPKCKCHCHCFPSACVCWHGLDRDRDGQWFIHSFFACTRRDTYRIDNREKSTCTKTPDKFPPYRLARLSWRCASAPLRLLVFYLRDVREIQVSWTLIQRWCWCFFGPVLLLIMVDQLQSEAKTWPMPRNDVRL